MADVENTAELVSVSMGFHGEDFCLGFPIRTTGQTRLIGLIPEKYKTDGEAPKDFSMLIPHVESILPISVTNAN